MGLLRRSYKMLKSSGVLRPELVVAIFCFLLPDLLDKPLWMLGIGMGRFVGHTLLFVFLVAFVFFLIKRSYGLFALIGGMAHLLSDVNGIVPWLYPFKKYDFPQWEFWDTLRWYWVVRWFVELMLVVLVVFLLLFFMSHRKNRGDLGPRDDEATGRTDKP
ncbi:MAG: metal-dependent hydrolase [Dehalococcoidia bacterium]|nr:metal-dependent hydrolase [Dehalococcoidia bacterium]